MKKKPQNDVMGEWSQQVTSQEVISWDREEQRQSRVDREHGRPTPGTAGPSGLAPVMPRTAPPHVGHSPTPYPLQPRPKLPTATPIQYLVLFLLLLAA